MPKNAIVITDGTVKFVLGAAAPVWTGAVDASCQIISAAVTVSPVTSTAAATFCEGETDVVGNSKWNVELSGLQDVTEATGVSMFLFTNDAALGWVQIVGPDKDAAGQKKVTVEAKVRFVAGDILGAAGSPLEFSCTMPCQQKPTVVQATNP